MRAVIQRVSSASVHVKDRRVGHIGRGLLVLLGVGRDDDESDVRFLADKCAGLRIFEDENGKMNLSVKDIGGAVLVVSQFTLYGDARRGRRPSFTDAAPPDIARPLCDLFTQLLDQAGLPTATGEFGAMMDVSLVNDGPVTILLDSKGAF